MNRVKKKKIYYAIIFTEKKVVEDKTFSLIKKKYVIQSMKWDFSLDVFKLLK